MQGRLQRPQRPRLRGSFVILCLAACGLAALYTYSRHLQPTTRIVSQGVDTGSWNQLRRPLREVASEQPGSRQAMEAASEPWRCPLEYQRTSFEEVRQYQHKPYLLGGLQRPACRNCHRTKELWSEFCQFRSHGPTCTDWDQWRLLTRLIKRAEAGAVGAEALLTLTPCDLFELLEGKTLWLVGDSMTQELQRALQCFFYEFWELETHELFELDEHSVTTKPLPAGWCVFMSRRTRICHVRSNYGESLAEEGFPTLLRLGATAADVAVFNFGAWHNDAATFRGNASRLARYLAAHAAELPPLIWREVAPQHFNTPLGEYGCDGCPTPDAPYKCKAVTNVTLDFRNGLATSDPAKQILVEGGWRNSLIRPLIEQLGVPTLHVWNQSMPLWDFHHNFQAKDDCTHMCHPSAYQVWIYELYELLRRLRQSGSGDWHQQSSR